MAWASRGPIPKNAASKSPTFGTNDPARTEVAPGASGSGPNSTSKFHPRSAGNPETASRPSETNCHRSSGEVTPPGKRQPIPTTAIGSLSSRSSAAISQAFVRRGRPCPLAVRAQRLLRNVDEEVRRLLLIGLLEVAVGAHTLETRLPQQPPDAAFSQREHVQRVFAPIRERVFESRQAIVEVLRLRRVPLVDETRYELCAIEIRLAGGQRVLAVVLVERQQSRGVLQPDTRHCSS